LFCTCCCCRGETGGLPVVSFTWEHTSALLLIVTALIFTVSLCYDGSVLTIVGRFLKFVKFINEVLHYITEISDYPVFYIVFQQYNFLFRATDALNCCFQNFNVILYRTSVFAQEIIELHNITSSFLSSYLHSVFIVAF